MERKEFKSPTGEPIRAISDDLAHIFLITKEWSMVPDICWSSAYSQGAVSKDMQGRWLSPEENVAKIKAETHLFEQEVKAYIKEIMDEGNIDKMDNLGRPKVPVLNAKFTERKVNQTLRDKLWKQLK